MAIEHLHSDFSAVRIALINIAMRIYNFKNQRTKNLCMRYYEIGLLRLLYIVFSVHINSFCLRQLF